MKEVYKFVAGVIVSVGLLEVLSPEVKVDDSAPPTTRAGVVHSLTVANPPF